MIILIIGLSYLGILYVGGLKYASGEIKSIGTIAEFFIYIGMLVWPFTVIGWVTSVLQRAEASQKRINEFLETPEEIINMAEEKNLIEGKIEFKNVSFTYENTGIEALKKISFTVKPGETLAIMGKTGSGKSTIAELITRLYDVASGEIIIDEKPIKDINLYRFKN